MTAWLTRLPEDPRFEWRIHADDRPLGPPADRHILLTQEELHAIINAYYNWQDADEVCPACGHDPMQNQVPYHWEDEPIDQHPKKD